MLMSHKTAVLIDFDGVILRNHAAHASVVGRCNQFVKRYVSIRNPVKVSEINAALYRTFGHTAVGLRKVGFDVDINEFNSAVYDTFDYSNHFKDLTKTHARDINNFNEFIEDCYDNNLTPYIFSNAPDVWCKTILGYMDKNLCNLPTLSDITQVYLKPTKSCYDEVEKKLHQYEKLIFLDDSFANFKVISKNEKWIKIMISQTEQDAVLKITEDLFLTSKFPKLNKLDSSTVVEKSPVITTRVW